MHAYGWIHGLLGLALLGPGRLFAEEGVARTLSGKSFAGAIRLENNEVVIASVPESSVVRVPMAHLLELHLPPPPESSRTDLSSRRGEAAGTPAWRQADIGPVWSAGSAQCEAGRVRLSSGGKFFSSREDCLLFAFRSWEGDGEIVGRVQTLSPARGRARAGLMFRESLRPDARQVFLGTTPTGGVLLWREQAGAPSADRPARPLFQWLRLKRDGDWFLAYTSPDGRDWRLTDKIQLVLSPELLVGCALTGQEDTPLSSSRAPVPRQTLGLFDQVRTGTGLRHHSFVPHLYLRSGSLVVEDIAGVEDSCFRLWGTAPWPPIPLIHAARLDFQWIPRRLARQLQFARPGVLLRTGEFLEGDLKEFRAGHCVMSTVLFGLRRFDAHQEVASILLRPVSPRSGLWEARTWGGTVLRGTVLSLSERGVEFQEPVLGRLHVPFHALREISRRPSGG